MVWPTAFYVRVSLGTKTRRQACAAASEAELRTCAWRSRASSLLSPDTTRMPAPKYPLSL